MNQTDKPSESRMPWRGPFGAGVLIALAVLFFFLWTEHRAHLWGALPFLILLLCPLLHHFMHRGHHHHHDGGGQGADGGEANRQKGDGP